jgi:hypothetical protein
MDLEVMSSISRDDNTQPAENDETPRSPVRSGTAFRY